MTTLVLEDEMLAPPALLQFYLSIWLDDCCDFANPRSDSFLVLLGLSVHISKADNQVFSAVGGVIPHNADSFLCRMNLAAEV